MYDVQCAWFQYTRNDHSVSTNALFIILGSKSTLFFIPGLLMPGILIDYHWLIINISLWWNILDDLWWNLIHGVMCKVKGNKVVQMWIYSQPVSVFYFLSGLKKQNWETIWDLNHLSTPMFLLILFHVNLWVKLSYSGPPSAHGEGQGMHSLVRVAKVAVFLPNLAIS